MKLCHFFSILLVCMFTISIVPGNVSGQGMLIDHTCTDINEVPQYWIDQARDNLLIGYSHTSHGSQLVTGIDAFCGNPGDDYYFDSTGWGLSPGVFLNDLWGNAGGASDLGHTGDLGWRDATITMLANPENDRNVVMWSWCGGCSDNTEAGIVIYLDAMNALEASYPSITFIYMTGHLDGGGTAGNLNVRNNQIREYCTSNGKILFDFADIESYDPDGNYFLDLYANDNCGYSGGNWAQEWIAANPSHELTTISAGCGSCAHSQALNCVLKGRAFWWMMARIAGWDGGIAPTPTPVCFNTGDVDFSMVITAQDAQATFYIALGTIIPTPEEACAADCNGDGTVTAGDAQVIFFTVMGLDSCVDPV